MKTPAVFDEIVDEVRLIIKKIDDVEASKTMLQHEIDKLSDQKAGLLQGMDKLNHQAAALHARGREKMLELTRLHANNEAAGSNFAQAMSREIQTTR